MSWISPRNAAPALLTNGQSGAAQGDVSEAFDSNLPCFRSADGSTHMQCMHMHVHVGLARTINIRFIYGIFDRKITKYTVIYGVYIYDSGQPYVHAYAEEIHTHSYRHARACTRALTCAHTDILTYAHRCTHLCSCARTYIQTDRHAHTRTQH